MKKEYFFKFKWPLEAIFVGIAMGVIYGWRIGILSFFGIGLIYTIGGGK